MSNSTNLKMKNINFNETVPSAFLWNQGLYIASTVILGFTTYMLARYLAPHYYGIYSATMAFGSLATLFISFGFEGALNVYLPRLLHNLPKLRHLFRQILFRRVIVVLASFLLILLTILFDKEQWMPQSIKKLDGYLFLAIICAFISLISGLITHVLITLLRIKYYARIRVLNLIVSLILFLYLLENGYGVRGILWTTITISSIATLLYTYGCKDLLIGPSNKFSLGRIHKFGFTVWASNFFGYFLGKEIDIIIMSFFGISAAFIGIYQIATIITVYARMIVTKGMAGVLQSAFSSAYKNGGIESLRKWWLMSMKYQIITVTPSILFLILFARQIIESILPKYGDAILLLHVYGTLTLIITFLGGGAHITAFFAIGKEKIVLYTRIISGLINIILDIILIYFYGVLGAILATGISAVVGILLELSLSFILLRIKYPFILLAKNIFCLSLASVVSNLIIDRGIINLIFCGCGYLITYLFAAWIVKPFNGNDLVYFQKLNKFISKILIPFCR